MLFEAAKKLVSVTALVLVGGGEVEGLVATALVSDDTQGLFQRAAVAIAILTLALVGAVYAARFFVLKDSNQRRLEYVRDKERLGRSLLDLVADPVALANDHGIILTCNSSAESLFGYRFRGGRFRLHCRGLNGATPGEERSGLMGSNCYARDTSLKLGVRMARLWIGFSGVFGFTAVAFGALGAHILKHRLSEVDIERFETAVHYQMWHALALCAVAWLATKWQKEPPIIIAIAGWSFVLGTVLFSGSLFVLSVAGVSGFALVTPVGGTLLLTGWLAVFLSAFRMP